MHVIILAAGQGTRMSPLTDHTPKSLLPIGDSTILIRLIKQILKRNTGQTTVVVGHEKERITQNIEANFGKKVNIIENNKYLDDVNILSVSLAVADNEEPFIVFESDCLFDSIAMDTVFHPSMDKVSSWYTIGSFLPSQVGGILKADNNKNVTDIRIVKDYQDKYKDYDKLVGVLKVGINEVKSYLDYLNIEVKQDTKQYYLAPWINNLPRLPCIVTSLSESNVGAFNTPEEYHEVLNLFGESIDYV